MAFACHYLCDTNLADYIKTMIQYCTDNGDLNGLLVSGTSEAGINLLQSYLDRTDDVQTVALISIKFLSKDLMSHSQVEHWIARFVFFRFSFLTMTNANEYILLVTEIY